MYTFSRLLLTVASFLSTSYCVSRQVNTRAVSILVMSVESKVEVDMKDEGKHESGGQQLFDDARDDLGVLSNLLVDIETMRSIGEGVPEEKV